MLHETFNIIDLLVFTIYGDGDHLDNVTRTIYTNVRSISQGIVYMKSGFEQQVFSEENIFKYWLTDDDDGRTAAHRYTSSSPFEPYGVR